VDLTGWVATGGDVLAPLRDESVFARARIENYGAAVAWDDGDLAIDAVYLKKLAEEQRPERMTSSSGNGPRSSPTMRLRA
jgi:hypothetical protein